MQRIRAPFAGSRMGRHRRSIDNVEQQAGRCARNRSLVLSSSLLLLAVMIGCRPQPQAASTPASRPQESAMEIERPLRLLVIDDPRLAEAIPREWHAQTQTELDARSKSSSELRSGQPGDDPYDVDAIIFPTAWLGRLVTERRIVSWPATWRPAGASTTTANETANDTDDYGWNDIFPWIQRRELRWGDQLCGVSLGSPQFMLWYRSDLFAAWSLEPPATWEAYQAMLPVIQAKLTESASADLPRFATVEPLGPGWASRVFLARAAAYVRHPNQHSTLFHFVTMQPLIDQPSFVKSCDELVSSLPYQPTDVWSLSVDQAAERILRGDTVMAVTWPSPARDVVPESEVADNTTIAPRSLAGKLALAPLPGAQQVYSIADEQWIDRAPPQRTGVPLCGAAGRIGAIARRTHSPSAARNLLLWLTRAEQAPRISTRSSATTVFRTSQLSRPESWVEQPLAEAAVSFANILTEYQQSPEVLLALTIPGEDRYHEALEAALQRVGRHECTSTAALQDAARAWQHITEQLGRDAQQKAFQASLGLGSSGNN